VGIVVALGMSSVILLAQAPGEPLAREPFAEWMTALRQEAVARGVTAATVERALAFDEPLEVVVERDRTQAETVLTVEQYIDRRLTRVFVRSARQRAAEQRALLRNVGGHYEVQPRFLVAIWGLESNFGRFSGVRPTVQALATLAWDGRRGALFRGELFAALEILDRGYAEVESLKGSWAGAMGQTQFMPSSYLKYAQDFDGDGHRDIWASSPDVFASIANYLKEHGWDGRQTWGREVQLPAGGWRAMVDAAGLRDAGCRARREMTVALPMERWSALGVRSAGARPLPRVDRAASLVSTGRRTFLTYQNYEALLDYNCAHAYALSVGVLADRIGP
jgi:membrane-bound lytic murein transglycosylase B